MNVNQSEIYLLWILNIIQGLSAMNTQYYTGCVCYEYSLLYRVCLLWILINIQGVSAMNTHYYTECVCYEYSLLYRVCLLWILNTIQGLSAIGTWYYTEFEWLRKLNSMKWTKERLKNTGGKPGNIITRFKILETYSGHLLPCMGQRSKLSGFQGNYCRQRRKQFEWKSAHYKVSI
jgi:hypothetical protein